MGSLDGEDAIAIIGIGCKFPGAENVDEFWRVLSNGENHVLEIPRERWDNNIFYDSNVEAVGKSYVQRAGLVKTFKEWDNRLYGINDIEAARMDPQQRWLLDCTFQALENAGIPLSSIHGSNTGVFVGAMNSDYVTVLNNDCYQLTNYSPTGGALSICPARISYTFNLLGPCLAIDTACSSALVAIQVAMQAIKAGDCSLAICGGVNCLLAPENFIALSRARMVSPSGQCQTFSADADGYARGEGCGVVLLKPLRKAIEDNDPIWATLGTCWNQDGRTATPITAPSRKQQESLLLQVYDQYNINPKDIEYFEAHGTGTPIGDPIEANTVGKIIGSKKSPGGPPCYIGSVKTNIGHLESGAGVAGLIKVLLMMKHGSIVPSLHFNKPNPSINFNDMNLKVPTELTKWSPQDGKTRLASINSFGFGGTNSHAVIQQYPQRKVTDKKQRNRELVVMSAQNAWSLKRVMEETVDALSKVKKGEMSFSLGDIAYTCNARRSHFSYRVARVVQSLDDLQTQLENLLNDPPSKPNSSDSSHRIIFVFCGMGTHWSGMCTELLETEPHFAETLRKVDRELQEVAGWSVIEKLKSRVDLSNPAIGQPALFACQVALARLWEHWGVNADVIMGHSVGEVAAAHISGSLTLSAAVNVIYHRGRLLSNVKGGKMLVVGKTPVERMHKLCEKFSGRVCVAAENSGTSCTLSGDTDCIQVIKKQLDEENEARLDQMFIRELDVAVAFHSHHMDPVLDEFRESLSTLSGKKPAIYSVSTVTGCVVDDDDFTTAEYWTQNMRNSVQFRQAVERAVNEEDHNIFVEIGPRPALRSNIKEIASDKRYTLVASMRPQVELDTMLQSLADLCQIGMNPNWTNVYKEHEAIPLDIPKYQFRPVHNFFEPESWKVYRQGMKNATETAHPFVTMMSVTPPLFKITLNRKTSAFIFDHLVSNTVVAPGATYVEMGLASIWTLVEKTARLDQLCFSVEFLNPTTIGQDERVELQCHVSGPSIVNGDPKYTFEIEADGKPRSVGHCFIQKEPPCLNYVDIDAVRMRCHESIHAETVYTFLDKFNFSFGPLIHTLRHSVRNERECLTEVEIPAAILKESNNTVVHPVILDTILQAIATITYDPKYKEKSQVLWMPYRIGHMVTRGPVHQTVAVYCQMLEYRDSKTFMNAVLLDKKGTVLLECRDIGARGIQNTRDVEDAFGYSIGWRPVDIEQLLDSGGAQSETQPYCLIIGNPSNMSRAIATKTSPNSFTVPSSIFNQTNFRENEMFLSDYLKIHHPTWTSCDAIIHLMSTENHSDSDSAEQLDEYIQAACASLRQLLNGMLSAAIMIPLYVITYKAQCVTNLFDQDVSAFQLTDKTQVEEINLLGSPLWGMMRTVLAEYVTGKAKLLDISTCDESEIQNLMHVVKAAKFPDHPEIAFRSDKTYVNELFMLKPQHDNFKVRENVAELGCNIRLKSSSSQVLQNLHCKYGSVTSESLKVDHVRVALTNVALDTGLFPRTVTELTDMSPCWPADDYNGHDVIALDVVGEVVETQPGSKFKKGDSVIACYPVPVSSTHDIPEACVLKKDHIPADYTYLLSKLVLAWHIASTAGMNQGKKKIHLVTASQEDIMGHLLCSIASTTGSTVEIVKRERLENSKVLLTGSVVLLSALNKKQLNSFQSSIGPNCPLVVTIDEIVRPILKILKSMVNITLMDFSVQTVYHPGILAGLVKEVVAWLQGHKKVIPPETKTETIEVRSMDLNTAFQNTVKRRKPRPAKERDDSIAIFHFPQKSAKLKNLPVQVTPQYLFRQNAGYLLIGGLTGLGWELMQYMAKKGAGYLYPMSRRPPTDANKDALHQLENDTGVKIYWVQGDVTDLQSIKKVLSHLQVKFPNIPLKGLFHGAIVLHDAYLVNMDQKKFETATKPKILGAWNLHQATKEIDMDYFIMHSSTTSIMGNAGQTNYGAGNAFMDSLAFYRRSHGLPAQVINWGPLNIGVLRDNAEVTEILAKQGYFGMDVPDILRCFEHALATNEIQLSFLVVDWKIIAEHTETKPFMQHLKTRYQSILQLYQVKHETKEDGDKAEKVVVTLDDIISMSGEKKKEKVVLYVQALVADIFAVELGMVHKDTKIMSLGMDSMLAMTLRSRISAELAINVPVVLLLSQDTTVLSLTNAALEAINERYTMELPTSDNSGPQIKLASSLKRAAWKQQVEVLDNLHDPTDIARHIRLILKMDFNVFPRDPEFWAKVVYTLIERHPGIRLVYAKNEDSSVSGTAIDAEDMKMKTTEATAGEAMKVIDELTLVPFHLTKEPPLRVTMVYTDDDHGYLVFIFHHICLDYKGLAVVMGEFPIILTNFRTGHKLPPPGVASIFDIPNTYETLVEQQLETLESFWKETIPVTIPSMRLPSMLGYKGERITGHCKAISAIITENLQTKLFQFTSKSEVTMFQTFVSAYQILLQYYLQVPVVVVSGAVDLRIEMPKFENSVADLSNDVFLIADFSNKDMTFDKFVTTNAKNILEAVQHSLYPQQLLGDLLGSKTMAKNGMQHVVVFEDTTLFHMSRTMASQYGVNILESQQYGIEHDTRMCLKNNTATKEIEIELTYSVDIMTSDEAARVFDDFMHIFEMALTNPVMKITELLGDHFNSNTLDTILAPQVRPTMDIHYAASDASSVSPCDSATTGVSDDSSISPFDSAAADLYDSSEADRELTFDQDAERSELSSALTSAVLKHLNNNHHELVLLENPCNLFDQVVRNNPKKMAFITATEHFTYTDLQNTIHKVASAIKLAVADTMFGKQIATMFSHEDPLFLASIMACWKLGYSVLVLPYKVSENELQQVKTSCSFMLLVTSRAFTEKQLAKNGNVPLLVLSQQKLKSYTGNLSILNSNNSEAETLYIIQERNELSAVTVDNASLMNHLEWLWNRHPLADDEQCKIYGMEKNVYESLLFYLMCLLKGASVYSEQSEYKRADGAVHPDQKSRLCCDVDSVGEMRTHLLLDHYDNVKPHLVIIAGQINTDTISLLRQCLPNAAISYFISFSVIPGIALWQEVTPNDITSSAKVLGRPIHNTQVALLPTGQYGYPSNIGELCLASSLRNFSLNAPDVVNIDGEKYARTGTVVRIGMDGCIWLMNGDGETEHRIDNESYTLQESIPDLIINATKTHTSAVALSHQGLEINYSTLGSLIGKVMAGVRAFVTNKTCSVALFLPGANALEIATHVALWKMGYTVIPLADGLTLRTVYRLLMNTSTKLVVTNSVQFEKAIKNKNLPFRILAFTSDFLRGLSSDIPVTKNSCPQIALQAFTTIDSECVNMQVDFETLQSRAQWFLQKYKPKQRSVCAVIMDGLDALDKCVFSLVALLSGASVEIYTDVFSFVRTTNTNSIYDRIGCSAHKIDELVANLERSDKYLKTSLLVVHGTPTTTHLRSLHSFVPDGVILLLQRFSPTFTGTLWFEFSASSGIVPNLPYGKAIPGTEVALATTHLTETERGELCLRTTDEEMDTMLTPIAKIDGKDFFRTGIMVYLGSDGLVSPEASDSLRVFSKTNAFHGKQFAFTTQKSVPLTEKSRMSLPQILMEDTPFLKKTSGGRSHITTLKIVSIPDPSGSRSAALLWGNRCLLVDDITNLYISTEKGVPSLTIVTDKRSYVFQNKTQETINGLFRVIADQPLPKYNK